MGPPPPQLGDAARHAWDLVGARAAARTPGCSWYPDGREAKPGAVAERVRMYGW